MRTRTRLQFPGFAAIPAQALCHSFLRRKVARLVSVTKRQVSELGAEFLPENPLNLCARNRLQVGAWRHFLGVTVNRSFGARY
jgi:hypothetical protein